MSKGDSAGSNRPEEQSDPPGPAVRSRVWLHGQDGREGCEWAGDKPRGQEGGITMQRKVLAEGCRWRHTGWPWRDRDGEHERRWVGSPGRPGRAGALGDTAMWL